MFGFSGVCGQQVVLIGGGVELVGLVDYVQVVFGKLVWIGMLQCLFGLVEVYVKFGFVMLVGIVFYVVVDFVDICVIGFSYQLMVCYKGFGLVGRVVCVVMEYF